MSAAPEARDRLAAGQAALVRALVGGGPVPGGFDPGRVRATSTALARKRAREVARAWPALAAELGEDFTGEFLAYAAGRPPPAVLDLVAELCARRGPPGVMLERDDDYPPEAELAAELDAIAAACHLAGRPN